MPSLTPQAGSLPRADIKSAAPRTPTTSDPAASPYLSFILARGGVAMIREERRRRRKEMMLETALEKQRCKVSHESHGGVTDKDNRPFDHTSESEKPRKRTTFFPVLDTLQGETNSRDVCLIPRVYARRVTSVLFPAAKRGLSTPSAPISPLEREQCPAALSPLVAGSAFSIWARLGSVPRRKASIPIEGPGHMV